jgi:hypothetical protein
VRFLQKKRLTLLPFRVYTVDSGSEAPTKNISGGYIMENVTKARGFSPSIMARVDACAYIFMADKPEKIRSIAENRGVSELDAGRIYTIGALKAAKRRGTARTYREALGKLESEQLGYRGDSLYRTISADNTARVVALYQRMNDRTPMRVNTVDVVRMAWARMDNQPLTEYAQDDRWHTTEPEHAGKPKRNHTLNTGRVLGTLYTEWEAREAEAYPVDKAQSEVIEQNIRLFFAEYESRLSKTVKMRVSDLAEYIRKEGKGNKLKEEQAVKALMSNRGKKAPETSKMAKFADNLHQKFTHKDAISCLEFIILLYRYGRWGGDTL